MDISDFRDIIDIRRECQIAYWGCENCHCPLQVKGVFRITVCDLISHYLSTQPRTVDIVYNCPIVEDPLGIKNFYEHVSRGYIRPTSEQIQNMKNLESRCINCSANTRIKMKHPNADLFIAPHLCTTIKSTILTIKNISSITSCSLSFNHSKTGG